LARTSLVSDLMSSSPECSAQASRGATRPWFVHGAVWRASDFLLALNLCVVVLLGGIAVLAAFGLAGLGKQNQRAA
jgi:hypothetical protein